MCHAMPNVGNLQPKRCLLKFKIGNQTEALLILLHGDIRASKNSVERAHISRAKCYGIMRLIFSMNHGI
jgi:hypothetical protein